MNAPTPRPAKLVWHEEPRRLADLLEYDQNPRTITKPQFAKLKKSLKDNGYHARIAINADGRIVAGHMRRRAMLEMKEWGPDATVPVLVPNRPLTPEEFDEVNLRDNVEFGSFDIKLLGARFEQTFLTDLGLNINLGTSPKGNTPAKDPDETPAVPSVARTTPGDVYEIGPHRLMCGSATDEAHVQTLMAGAQAEMVFTDPPYNVAYVGKTKDALTIQNDKMGGDEFLEFLRAAYRNLAASTSAGGAIYVAHADTEGLRFRQGFVEAGFKLSGCLVWVKPSMVLGRSDYQWRHEPILYGWKEGASHRWRGDRKQTTVWEVDRPSRSSEHPTMKPIALIDIALANSSAAGDLVIDFFGGSGSTMVAAHKGGRHANLMELDPKYCDVIVSRMLDIYPDLKGSLKRNGETIVWEQTGENNG